MQYKRGIYWLKKDFRLLDNPALTSALSSCESVLPVYILEPSHLIADDASAFHFTAIATAFNDLHSKIISKGGQVAHVESNVIAFLDKSYDLYKFEVLFSHEEIGVDRTYARDKLVKKWCLKHKVKWIELPQTGVCRGLTDRNKRMNFWKSFYAQAILPIPDDKEIAKLQIPKALKSMVNSEKLDVSTHTRALLSTNIDQLQVVSESRAHIALKSFLTNRGINYSGGISSPNTAFMAGSRLSVHLAWGTISGRYVFSKANAQRKWHSANNSSMSGKWKRSISAFQSRLHWRDHFIQRLEREPRMEFYALNAAYENIEYDGSEEFLELFLNGQTGFPMIDACMRCLQQTGFLNFRMRAMITSFACHALRLDWRTINGPLAKLFLDYEPGIHLSQIQMQAGVVGINTIRVYSPQKQIIDHDLKTTFIKKWVPELERYSPAEIIHSKDFQLGKYSRQIVNFKIESKKMKDQLWKIKGLEETKRIADQVYQKHGSRKRPRRFSK